MQAAAGTPVATVACATAGGFCPVGHALFVVRSGDSTVRCDQCVANIAPYSTAFSCSWCGYDLCPECHARLWPSSAAAAMIPTSTSGPIAVAVPMSLPSAIPIGAAGTPNLHTCTGVSTAEQLPVAAAASVAVAANGPASVLPLAAACPVALDTLSAAEQAAAPIAVALPTPATAASDSGVHESRELRLAPSVPLSALERRIRRAKLKARPMLFLHQWYRWQHHKLPLDLGLPPPSNNIEVIDGLAVSPADFRKRYELLYRPVLIDGLLAGHRCEQHWTPEAIGAKFGEW